MKEDAAHRANRMKRLKRAKRTIYKITGRKWKWRQLKAIGGSKLIKSSYYWIVLVPVLAKMTHGMTEHLPLKIFNVVIDLNLTLPFSWKAFFFAALAFGVGSILFDLYCPSIIKNYANYSDYAATGKTALDLKYAYLQTTNFFDADPGEDIEDLKDFYKCATGKRFSMLTEEDNKFFLPPSSIPTQNVDRIIGLDVPNGRLPEVFDFVVERSQSLEYIPLCLAAICFAIGGILLAFNLMQNVISVIGA